MFRTTIRVLLVALACIASELCAAGGVVVIANASVAQLDIPTLQRIYLGRVIEVRGVPITAVNAKSGSATRSQFLQTFIKQDDDAYAGYWLVRRYAGLGAPPRELSSSAEVIDFVKSTPGAIGYIDAADVPHLMSSGVNVLMKTGGQIRSGVAPANRNTEDTSPAKSDQP